MMIMTIKTLQLNYGFLNKLPKLNKSRFIYIYIHQVNNNREYSKKECSMYDYLKFRNRISKWPRRPGVEDQVKVEQFRERSCTLPYTFGSTSTAVANFTFTQIGILETI